MGVIGPARRSRKHLAAWSLTIVTLAVLAATLVLAALNSRRTGVPRLTEELDADTVTEDLARSVHTALEPAHVSIWLSER